MAAAAMLLLLLLLLTAAAEGVTAGGVSPDGRLARAGHNLYHATLTFLLDRLLPPDTAGPQPRWVCVGGEREGQGWRKGKGGRSHGGAHTDVLSLSTRSVGGGGYSMDVACMGAVYRRSGGGGSVCVDAVTAAAVVGGALLLQFLFYAAVTSACPTDVSYLSGLSSSVRNITYVINVNNSNTIGVQMMAGDQSLMQTQDQDQGLTQGQTADQDVEQNAAQTVDAPQTQTQDQDQGQSQDDYVFNSGTIRRRRDDPGDYDHPDDPDYEVVGSAIRGTVEDTEEPGRGAALSARGRAGRRRRWSLPPLGVAGLDLSNLALSRLDLSDLRLNLCPALGLYIGR